MVVIPTSTSCLKFCLRTLLQRVHRDSDGEWAILSMFSNVRGITFTLSFHSTHESILSPPLRRSVHVIETCRGMVVWEMLVRAWAGTEKATIHFQCSQRRSFLPTTKTPDHSFSSPLMWHLGTRLNLESSYWCTSHVIIHFHSNV